MTEYLKRSLLISRSEAIKLCDNLRSLLDDPPSVPIGGPNLAIFPEPKQQTMKLGIKK